jgi:hypothetical protein
MDGHHQQEFAMALDALAEDDRGVRLDDEVQWATFAFIPFDISPGVRSWWTNLRRSSVP